MATSAPTQNQLALQTYLQQKQDPEWYLDVNDPELKNISSALADSMDNSDIDTLLQLASIYIDAGQEKKIITLCERKYEQDNTVMDLLSTLARQECLKGNDSTGIMMYRLDLKKNRMSVHFKSYLALEEAKLGNWDLAEKLVSDNYNAKEYHAASIGTGFLGIEHIIKDNDPKHAYQNLKKSKVLKTWIESTLAAYNRDPDRAIEIIENQYSINSGSAGHLDFIGWYFVWIGDVEQGYQFMLLERKYKREYSPWRINFPITLGLLGRFDEALAVLDTITAPPLQKNRVGNLYYKPSSITKTALTILLQTQDHDKLKALIKY